MFRRRFPPAPHGRRRTALHAAVQCTSQDKHIHVQIPIWDERAILNFILTGNHPVLRIYGELQQNFRFPGLYWVTLKFEVRLKAEELAQAYKNFTSSLPDHVDFSRKPLSEKHNKLAIFYSERKGRGDKWYDLMHEWNRKYPNWEYENYKNFTRDAVHATRRVMNEYKLYKNIEEQRKWERKEKKNLEHGR